MMTSKRPQITTNQLYYFKILAAKAILFNLIFLKDQVTELVAVNSKYLEFAGLLSQLLTAIHLQTRLGKNSSFWPILLVELND